MNEADEILEQASQQASEQALQQLSKQASLQTLLQNNPRLWRGLNGWEHTATGLSAAYRSTGYSRLDRCLTGGGWPRYALTEILLQQPGLGELKLLMPALASMSQQGAGAGEDSGEGSDEECGEAGWITWIAPPYQPYPPALLQWGVDLSRLLVVRPKLPSDALWAAEQALVSGSCAAVLLWFDALDDQGSRRLQLAAEKGRSWAVVLRSLRGLSQSSAAALRIQCIPDAGGTSLRILKNRGSRPGLIRNYAGT